MRVLESGEIERVGSSRSRRVNVRVLSATNSDLSAACASGQFREDLLFRLNTVEIHLPALRERREDIPALAAHFLARYSARYRRPVKGFDPAALQTMMQYAWPGNVRELEHTVERAVLMCRGNEIQPADLALSSQRASSQGLEDLSLEAVEAMLVRKALQRYQGNVSQAAEALGLSRGALYRRMEKYGVCRARAETCITEKTSSPPLRTPHQPLLLSGRAAWLDRKHHPGMDAVLDPRIATGTHRARTVCLVVIGLGAAGTDHASAANTLQCDRRVTRGRLFIPCAQRRCGRRFGRALF